jgi:hypothetical protein
VFGNEPSRICTVAIVKMGFGRSNPNISLATAIIASKLLELSSYAPALTLCQCPSLDHRWQLLILTSSSRPSRMKRRFTNCLRITFSPIGPCYNGAPPLERTFPHLTPNKSWSFHPSSNVGLDFQLVISSVDSWTIIR